MAKMAILAILGHFGHIGQKGPKSHFFLEVDMAKWPKMAILAQNGHFGPFWPQNRGFGRKWAILAIFEGHFSVVGGSEAIFGHFRGSWPRTPDLAILTPFSGVAQKAR